LWSEKGEGDGSDYFADVSSPRKLAFIDQRISYCYLGGVIDREHGNGRTSDIGRSNHHRTIPAEMVFPHIAPWVKQADHLICLWIDARDIGPLVAVTKPARECEIALDGRALVLSGYHVIDRKRQARESLGQPAIFARISRAVADQFFEHIVHAKLRLPDYAS
jgi:hypothetical protein